MAKILIADDEQKIREVVREYSEFNGHEVAEAADGMAMRRMKQATAWRPSAWQRRTITMSSSWIS